MKWLTHTITLFVGGLIFWLAASIDLVSARDDTKFEVSISAMEISYSDFISILLTVVTIVLGCVGLAVAVVAAFTVHTVKDDAKDVVEKAVDARMEMVKAELSKIAMGRNLSELENSLFPEDQEEER